MVSCENLGLSSVIDKISSGRYTALYKGGLFVGSIITSKESITNDIHNIVQLREGVYSLQLIIGVSVISVVFDSFDIPSENN